MAKVEREVDSIVEERVKIEELEDREHELITQEHEKWRSGMRDQIDKIIDLIKNGNTLAVFKTIRYAPYLAVTTDRVINPNSFLL